MARGSGRGYSHPRGSYRGSGRGNSSWQDRGNISYSSSRNGQNSSWNTSGSNSFDARSRYSSTNSSYRGRDSSSSFRRPYRSDGPANNYHREPNRSPERKKMRYDVPQSSRRTHGHDSTYPGNSYSSDGNASRYESVIPDQSSYSDRRSFSDDRRTFNDDRRNFNDDRRSFNEDRRSFEERRSNFRPREDFRKPMAPPMSTPRLASRGGAAGINKRSHVAVSENRGSRLSIRERMIRRQIIQSKIRKRRPILRSNTDYFHRSRFTRIRRPPPRRQIPKKVIDEKKTVKKDENSDETATESTKVKEENTKTENEEKATSATEKGDEMEESDKKEKSPPGEDDNRQRKKLIPLYCVHCAMKSDNFRQYSLHLFSTRHKTAMRLTALRQKTTLARMRQEQRREQREIEKDETNLASKTSFCLLCKLNYRQLKETHQMSNAHRNMKKFLMPYCRICRVTLKSPMLYENHICSLIHLKRKYQVENMNGDNAEFPSEEDLEEFTTLDSVGDADDDKSMDCNNESSPTEDNEGNQSKDIAEFGTEYVKLVSAFHCVACQMCLKSNDEAVKKKHCLTRMHRKSVLIYIENKNLERQTEKIHHDNLDTTENNEIKQKSENEKHENQLEENKGESVPISVPDAATTAEEDETMDEKIWEDVDKDLGEILANVSDPIYKSSDEEDEKPTDGRFDRFRISDKETVNNDEEKSVTEEASDNNEIKKDDT